jgi:hypothetical protein
MAIAPKRLNVCRAGDCCRISVTISIHLKESRMMFSVTDPRLSGIDHFTIQFFSTSGATGTEILRGGGVRPLIALILDTIAVGLAAGAAHAARVFTENVARVTDTVVPLGPAKVSTWAPS